MPDWIEHHDPTIPMVAWRTASLPVCAILSYSLAPYQLRVEFECMANKGVGTWIGMIFFNFLKPKMRLQTPCSSSLYMCRISSHSSLSSSLLLSKTKGAVRQRWEGAPWKTHMSSSTLEGSGFSRGMSYPRPECRLRLFGES